MILVSYDFSNDKVRAKFSKFLKKYGRRVQYSVYEIRNSDRILQNILDEIEYKYRKMFKYTDSVLIYEICEGCKKKVRKYGFAENEEEDVLWFE